MSTKPAATELRDALRSLTLLALDMRWSWSHATDEVWHVLDPDLWARTHNPWVVLRTVSHPRLETLLSEPSLRAKVLELAREARATAAEPAWFQQVHGRSGLQRIAYFSMEFMLSEALPIYAGGLGNVAGDQLKAASDLGVPVVGVGLLYQTGYFRQVIDRTGAQEAIYPYNDPGQLPITPLRRADGEWLRVALEFPGGSLWLRTWQVQVGRLKLYLLDSNDAANLPVYRGITSQLYGGGPELRLQQELVLGIGGWRLLAALDELPDVCHLNEGHAAFAVLERARAFRHLMGQTFEDALTTTRAGNLFTSHTAVAAGFDLFAPELLEQYLARYAQDQLGVSLADVLALGRRDPLNQAEPFNMAYLAVRGCAAVNGVSRLHRDVSRAIFAPLFPRWPLAEIPVHHVTNGVHMPSWDSPESDTLWTQACGKDRWRGNLEFVSTRIRSSTDRELWEMRNGARRALVDDVRERLSQQLGATGMEAGAIMEASRVLQPDALTLGFARRFAAYKRPNLLLADQERLIRLLTNSRYPVQLIIAGKAHPADGCGQDLIRDWITFVRHPAVRPHAVFLADYDMLLTEMLVRGVDLWINTPRRPWEACGTSGMKILVNGGLNLSELDGWWAEAYAPELGWALGDGRAHGNSRGEEAAWDAAEATRLYELLEQEILPQFYARDGEGIPCTWLRRVRESMAELTPRFSANRAVREYVEHHYVRAAAAYRERAASGGAAGALLGLWLRKLRSAWPLLRFGRVTVESHDAVHDFEVEVQLGGLEPQDVCVQLYADALSGRDPFKQEMIHVREAPDGMLVYRASAPADRAPTEYTPRIIAAHPEAILPLEAPCILWAR